MGKCVKLHTPTAAMASVSTSISQRWRIENRMIASSAPPPAPLSESVRMLGPFLLEVRLDQVALGHDHLFAWLQA